MNIFLPSLPAMAAYFDAPYSQVQLSVSLYLALSGALQLLIGPLTDRYGRRPVLLAALIGFILASVGVLTAPTIEIFLICRMLQAVISTAMVLSRAVVRDMVPPDRAASMIGWLTMGFSLIPMVAPAVGGLLEQSFGWQASFILLLVLALLTTVLTWADLGETATRGQSSLRAQIKAYPVLLSSRRFWSYALAGAVTSGVFYAYLGGAPAIGAHIYHLDTAMMGVYFACAGVGYLVGNFVSARLATRMGIDRMVLLGCLVSVFGTVCMVLGDLMGIHHALQFFGWISLIGVGNGMTLPSANSGMMSVRADLIGSASGLGAALMVGGGAAFSVIAGHIADASTTAQPLMLMMLVTAIMAVVLFLAVKPR